MNCSAIYGQISKFSKYISEIKIRSKIVQYIPLHFIDRLITQSITFYI